MERNAKRPRRVLLIFAMTRYAGGGEEAGAAPFGIF